MEFKDTLKQLRMSKKMSQVELADALGISAAAIGMYESGQRIPREEIKELIANYFNVDEAYLMGKDRTNFYVDPITAAAQGVLLKNRKIVEVVFACEGLSDKEIDFIVGLIRSLDDINPINP